MKKTVLVLSLTCLVAAFMALTPVIGAGSFAGRVQKSTTAATYQSQCAKCHGESGQSDTSIGKAMKVPALAGDANVQKMSDADVAARIKGNAKHPATIKGLSADDVNAVAAYVKQLAGK